MHQLGQLTIHRTTKVLKPPLLLYMHPGQLMPEEDWQLSTMRSTPQLMTLTSLTPMVLLRQCHIQLNVGA